MITEKNVDNSFFSLVLYENKQTCLTFPSMMIRIRFLILNDEFFNQRKKQQKKFYIFLSNELIN